jgi:spermidine synthase
MRTREGAGMSPASRSARGRVRVESDRFGKRLIVDETFASLYRPETLATGCVWDALAAPLLALPPGRRRRILLLGLGGGSVARILRGLAPRAEIVGVELDSEVIRLARAHFDLDGLGLEIRSDDALDVLRHEKRRFDLIVEDVFVGRGDAVHKPDWLPHPGLDLAAARLARGGLLVSNTLDEAASVASALARRFPGLLRIEVEDYDNRIFVAGPEGLDARGLRRAVASDPVLGESVGILGFRDWRRRARGRERVAG